MDLNLLIPKEVDHNLKWVKHPFHVTIKFDSIYLLLQRLEIYQPSIRNYVTKIANKTNLESCIINNQFNSSHHWHLQSIISLTVQINTIKKQVSPTTNKIHIIYYNIVSILDLWKRFIMSLKMM